MNENVASPQCQYFVVRKKRLCRMTVKPGRSYCGEHEPKPVTADGQDDTRVPCPYDSKHTCYVSKLQHHLTICNARPSTPPPYVKLNVNTAEDTVVPKRIPLGQLPNDEVLRVVEKVHRLYQEYVESSVSVGPSHPIHMAVLPEFTERGRTEASLRHLRQASSLLHLMEAEGLVRDQSCYVELGAGKGQLSLFVWRVWCENKPNDNNVASATPTANKVAKTDEKPANTGSGVLLVDRASLRHKRDAKMRVETSDDSEKENWVRIRADLAHVALQQVPVVANKRHLVGLAKHLCGVATDYALRSLCNGSASGGVLATCCHHRCELIHYTGHHHLQDLGLSPEEQNVMLGIVSWATCGDGRARTHASKASHKGNIQEGNNADTSHGDEGDDVISHRDDGGNDRNSDGNDEILTNERLIQTKDCNDDTKVLANNTNSYIKDDSHEINTKTYDNNHRHDTVNDGNNSQNNENNTRNNENTQKLSQEARELAGRRAKALLDYGRVLYLREHGFDARLCHFVPAAVSLENVCIIAKKI